MPKVNKAEIRRNVVAELVAFFDASGVEYTCSSSVYKVIDTLSTKRAQELLDQGINLSKSSYTFNFVPAMAGMFSSDAVKVIHEREYPKK